MPHKVVKQGRYYRVRSYTTGRLLKRKYATKASAKRRAMTSYRRSKRKRSAKGRRY